MKIRIFHFSPDATGRADFQLAYEAVIGRDPKQCVGEERQWPAQLLRALNAVSDPVGDLDKKAGLDGRRRTLKDAGGTIEITQRAHQKLETYLEEAPIHAAFAVAAEEFMERWGQAEKDDRDDVPGKAIAGPRSLEQAG